MTTTTRRIIDFDRLAKYEETRWANRAAGEPGQSPEFYREQIARCNAADEEHVGLLRHLAGLNEQIEQAVALHAETTRPLQREMEGASPERRVALRMKVNEANSVLETTIEPLKKAIEATRQEIEIVGMRRAPRTAIENAFADSGPPEEQERCKILQRAIDSAGPLLHTLRKRAEDETQSLAKERERMKHEGKTKFRGIEEAERVERIIRGTLDVVAGWVASAQAELNDIRAKRLRELYSG
jgi:hypothetical protein